MKQLLLLLFCTYSALFYAQCVENTSTTESTDNAPLSPNEMERGKDFNGDYVPKGLKIGGGINSGIFSSGFGKQVASNREGQTQYTDQQWNQNKTSGFMEIIYQLRTKRTIDFGLSGSWNSLWSNSGSFTNQPVYSNNPVSGAELHPLQWSMEQKVKLNTFLFFADLEILKLNKSFYLFIRPEIGISNYRSSVVFKTKDTCNCDELISRMDDNKINLTGGLNLGLNWEYKFIAIKSVLGYRIYNPMNFVSRDYFSQWKAQFDSGSYDFKGDPAAKLFSVDKPETTQLIGRRNGVFYFQLGLYLNIDKLLN